jgi:hypothetical protein
MKDDYQKKYTAGPGESVPNFFIAHLSLYDVKKAAAGAIGAAGN